MISEAIVFSYCNQFYAIELEYFVTILNSRDFSINNGNNEFTFCLDGERIKGSLINIEKYLGKATECIPKNCPFILGRIEDTFFGFEINKVEEILNIDYRYIEDIKFNANDYVKNSFSFDGNDYSVLNIEKIVEHNTSKINY
ncbi:MAG: chemotaxis protein CheW [Ignavibacteria bacterium]|jgi:chemotaxis signal transduction protein